MLYVSFQIFSVMDGYDENGLDLWCFREIDSTDLSLLIPAFLIFERHYWNSTYAYFDLLIPEWTRSKKLLGFSWMISSRSKIKNHYLYNDSTAAKYCSVAFIWIVTLPDFTQTHTLKQERIIRQRENLRALAEICEFY